MLIFLHPTDKDFPNAKEKLSNAKKTIDLINTPIKIGCTVTTTFYILKPAFMDIVNYLFYGIEPSRELPLKVKFFYDVKQWPTYQLTYLILGYGTAVVSAYIVSLLE